MIKQRETNSWKSVSYAKSISGTQTYTKFPIVLRTTQQSIPTWNVKGNMSQTGTPSPSSIIMPSECGDRTANLFDKDNVLLDYRIGGDGEPFNEPGCALSGYIEVTPNTIVNQNYIFSYSNCMAEYDENKTFIIRYVSGNGKITTTANTKYIRVAVATTRLDEAMVTMGATALSTYIPYGYKLDIKTGSTTTPIYLGAVQSTRNIKKLVLTGEENWSSHWSSNSLFTLDTVTDYLHDRIANAVCSHYVAVTTVNGYLQVNNLEMAFYYNASQPTNNIMYIRDDDIANATAFKAYLQQQYANGTPVTVWYVLATPTTGMVNEPIRKIGNYADTITNPVAIPTTSGINTIDVDTTLKPSEMSLTYDGYKLCKGQRYENGEWK